MTTPIISVQNLSKCYRLGLKDTQEDVLIHSLLSFLKAPLKSYRYLRSLTHFDHTQVNKDDPSVLWALQDINFEVEPGEAVGIIGQNGAGKSTLLKILSRVTQPTTGSIEIYGRLASLLEVGTGFHPDLTGRENVYLNGTILGMSKKEVDSRFDEIVDFAEISAFIDTPIKRYSSGMAVRLAFAVAAHLEPEILIVDEVLAVGDIAFQKKCLGKMKEVSQKKGRTVLFVSHNMGAIRTLCDKAMLLKKGDMVTAGSTETVITEYLSTIETERRTSIPLPSGGDDASVDGLSLELTDIEGSPKTEFRIEEPWLVTFKFEIKQDLGHVVAGIGISNVESVPIITYWSESKSLKKGQYQVTFKIDIPIAACDVNFAVGVNNAGRTIYFKNNLGHASISDIAVNKQPVCSRGTGILASFDRPPIKPLE